MEGKIDLVTPFVVYTLALCVVVLLGYRMYRYGRKHWCPRCHWFVAHPQYVREVLPWAPGGVIGHRRICCTRKVCPRCGFERDLSAWYIKTFTLEELAKGEKRSDVLNF